MCAAGEVFELREVCAIIASGLIALVALGADAKSHLFRRLIRATRSLRTIDELLRPQLRAAFERCVRRTRVHGGWVALSSVQNLTQGSEHTFAQQNLIFGCGPRACALSPNRHNVPQLRTRRSAIGAIARQIRRNASHEIAEDSRKPSNCRFWRDPCLDFPEERPPRSSYMFGAISQQSRLRAQVESAFAQFLRREAVERSQQSIVAFARQVTDQNHASYLGSQDQSEVISLLGGRTADSYQLELMRLLASPPL